MDWQSFRFAILSLLLVVGLNACLTSPPPLRLVVAIAASLKDVMAEVRTEFIQQYPEIDLQFNTGASGTLERQIEQQAPIDIFASASLKPLEYLTTQGFIEAEQVKIFAKNKLVLVQVSTSKNPLKGLRDLGTDTVGKVAMGNPKTVPAGQYAEKVLLKFPELYQALEEQQKLIFGENVRQVLTYIQSQEVDAGFVYQTDLYQQQNLRIIEVFPETLTGPIQYAIAPLKTSTNPDIAQQFIEFLLSETGQKILTKYGFLTIMSGEVPRYIFQQNTH